MDLLKYLKYLSWINTWQHDRYYPRFRLLCYCIWSHFMLLKRLYARVLWWRRAQSQMLLSWATSGVSETWVGGTKLLYSAAPIQGRPVSPDLDITRVSWTDKGKSLRSEFCLHPQWVCNKQFWLLLSVVSLFPCNILFPSIISSLLQIHKVSEYILNSLWLHLLYFLTLIIVVLLCYC